MGVKVHRIFLFGNCEYNPGETCIGKECISTDQQKEDLNHCAIVQKEADQYGDIIMADFVDSYQNLTIKSIMALEWYNKKYHHHSFLFKTDLDMLINVYKLIRFIKEKTQEISEALMFGICMQKDKAIRNPKNKAYLTYEEYPEYLFPSHCKGKLQICLSVSKPFLVVLVITNVTVTAHVLKRQGLQ